MSPTTRSRLIGGLIGIALIGAGLVIALRPFYETWSRGNSDAGALSDWNAGQPAGLTGAPAHAGGPTPAPGASACGASSGSSDSYALVTFTALQPQNNYAGVAADGDWNTLDTRSMVHWHGSADPGQAGNVIIAFHREPDFQHIDQLDTGGIVTIQDRSCHTYQYKVTQRWVEDPGKVDQLVNTTGHDLTLITCTPWWVDTQRIVWRATLVQVDGKPFSA